MTWYRFGNGVLNGSQYHDWSNLLMRRQLSSNGHRFVYHSFSLDIFFISHISDLSGIKMWKIEYSIEQKGSTYLSFYLNLKNLLIGFFFFYHECPWFDYSEIFWIKHHYHLPFLSDLKGQICNNVFSLISFYWLNFPKRTQHIDVSKIVVLPLNISIQHWAICNNQKCEDLENIWKTLYSFQVHFCPVDEIIGISVHSNKT